MSEDTAPPKSAPRGPARGITGLQADYLEKLLETGNTGATNEALGITRQAGWEKARPLRELGLITKEPRRTDWKHTKFEDNAPAAGQIATVEWDGLQWNRGTVTVLVVPELRRTQMAHRQRVVLFRIYGSDVQPSGVQPAIWATTNDVVSFRKVDVLLRFHYGRHFGERQVRDLTEIAAKLMGVEAVLPAHMLETN